MFYSPLRYPGGKNKLAKFIGRICVDNKISGHYVEPYAGGASVALYLLFNKHVKQITINDYDRSVYAFWYSILNHTARFCDLINQTEVTIANWRHQKSIQERKEIVSLLRLGFSTFFLNRTNISGILTGGVIGGLEQKGKYKIDCRFNKKDLISRIQKIAEYKKQINLENEDAINLIKNIHTGAPSSDAIFYFDPPYYIKGGLLYENHYVHQDHEKLAKLICSIKDARWIVSYDNHEEIKYMYRGYTKKEYSFFHTAHKAKEGKEVLFFSNDLSVPSVSNPTKIDVTSSVK